MLVRWAELYHCLRQINFLKSPWKKTTFLTTEEWNRLKMIVITRGSLSQWSGITAGRQLTSVIVICWWCGWLLTGFNILLRTDGWFEVWLVTGWFCPVSWKCQQFNIIIHNDSNFLYSNKNEIEIELSKISWPARFPLSHVADGAIAIYKIINSQ